MSANNVVWFMQYDGMWHVWYSGCIDNTPKQPNLEDKYYERFKYRSNAIIYAHGVVKKIDEEAYEAGFTGVEYGVCLVPYYNKLERIDKIINEWKQKIKDLQFSVEQFEDWKKKLIGGEKTVGGIDHSNQNHDSRVNDLPTDSKLPEYVLYPGIYGYIKTEAEPLINCNECDLYGECDHQGAYQKDGKWCYEASGGEKPSKLLKEYTKEQDRLYNELHEKLPEYSMTQKGLDAIGKIIKNSPQYKELKQNIYEDILACRGMDYKEMVNYLVELEKKYDEK